VATRRDRGSVETPRDGHRYVIDFEGKVLEAIGASTPPEAVVTAGNDAVLYDRHVTKNPVTGGWRVTFQIKPRDERPVELRAYLKHRGNVLTETWSSAWLP
jgi:glucans biosynthesis protein